MDGNVKIEVKVEQFAELERLIAVVDRHRVGTSPCEHVSDRLCPSCDVQWGRCRVSASSLAPFAGLGIVGQYLGVCRLQLHCTSAR